MQPAPRLPAQPPLANGGCRRLCCFSTGGVTVGLSICEFQLLIYFFSYFPSWNFTEFFISSNRTRFNKCLSFLYSPVPFILLFFTVSQGGWVVLGPLVNIPPYYSCCPRGEVSMDTMSSSFLLVSLGSLLCVVAVQSALRSSSRELLCMEI